MKCLLVFVLICNYSFSQDYSFNNFYEYENDNNGVVYFMTNDNNDNYHFYYNPNNGNIESYIVDYSTNVYHYYKVINKESNLKFEYLRTRKSNVNIKKYRKTDKVKYNYTSEFLDSSKSRTTITFNKISKNKTKIINKKAVIITNDSEERLFHKNHLEHYAHNYFTSTDTLNLDNKLPLRMIFHYPNGNIFDSKLKSSKKINTSLSISKKDKIYKR